MPYPFEDTPQLDLASLEHYHAIRRVQLKRKVEKDAEGIRKRSMRLAGFVREAWEVLEPANPYVHNWHIDNICAALESVTAGTIKRLLINVPPGMSKSLLVSVIWPAWEWGPMGLTHLRYVSTSYSENFTKRDNRRMRDFVDSDWYKSLWPHVKLSRRGETSFENTKTGARDARPFRSLTGGRGDRVIIDDPHSTETAESEPERETALRIFRESVPLRMNDPKNSAIVIIMQRLHERDVSGFILGHDDKMGYDTIVLPMEYEPDREGETTLSWAEERSKPGELLFPERFPKEFVERAKSIMGSYAVAGQLQQRPAPRGGGMFKRDWFEILPTAPAIGRVVRAVRWWDLAATAENAKSPDPAWTAGVLIVKDRDGLYYVCDVTRIRGNDLAVERLLKQVAEMDSNAFPMTQTVIPQDPGGAGKYVANRLIRVLAGYDVRKGKEDHAKDIRAQPFAAQCEAGNVKLISGPWNQAYLDELSVFPSSGHKDQVDASSGSFKILTGTGEVKVGGLKGLY